MKNTYSIVGTNHCGFNAQTIIKNLKPGAPVLLVREPENKFDKGAIAVYVGPDRVGYLPKNQNAELSAFIDQKGQPLVDIAMDEALRPKVITDGKSMPATFFLSPNSAFPQVRVGEQVDG